MKRFLSLSVLFLFCLTSFGAFGQETTAAAVDTYKIVCPAGQVCDISVRLPPVEEMEEVEGSIFGDWGLSAQGFGLGVVNGPTVGGMEALFYGDLRFAPQSSWYFIVRAGPGVAWLHEKERAAISEAAGVGYRADWLEIDLLARHRIVFDGKTDNVNALLGSVQLRFMLTEWLGFAVTGGVGGSWYQKVSHTTPQILPGYAPESPVLTNRKLARDVSWDAGGGFVFRF